MKIRSFHLGLLLVVMLFGGILFTSALGWWTTESSLEPVSYKDGDFAGEYDPADIRGSYGFAEVSDLFNIPIETLADAFMLPDSVDPQNFYNKDLEDLFESVLDSDQEIGNASVQLFVAFYNGLPFDLVEDIYLPSKAVAILKQEAILSEDQLSYLSTHTIQINSAQLSGAAIQENENLDEVELHDEDEMIVKGSTTFYDLIQWGVESSQIETVINDNMPATGLLIRDYCNQNGLNFGTIKVELQVLVDKAQ